VKLAAGNFTINKTLKVPTRVTLRGAGMGQTNLIAAGSFSGSRIVDFGSNYDETKWALYSSRGLNSPTKGAATITTTAAHGWAAGDIVLIDMLHKPAGDPPIEGGGTLGACNWCGRASGTRPIGQLVKVIAVPTTTTATIDPPLYWTYANTPQATKLTGGSAAIPVPFTELAGLEDVTLDDLNNPVQDLVGLMGTVSSWMLRVELKGSNRRAVWGFAGLWFTIQSCKIWGGTPIGADFDAHYHSDRAYGVFFGPHVTAALVTDSIFEKLTMAIAYEGAAAGNVFSYNYIGQMWWENTGDYPHRFGPLMHGPHPFMNLLEGNNSEERFRSDEYWGTSSHFTLLRNYIKQRPREGSHTSGWAQAWVVDIERRNQYYSLVGNVLGNIETPTPYEVEYELNNEYVGYSDGPKAIYKLGYKSLGEDSTEWNDPAVRGTLIRHKNYVSQLNNADSNTSFKNTTNGKGIEPDVFSSCPGCAIPQSYYLSARPDWFKDQSGNNLRWPPIQVESTPILCPNPAELRFKGIETAPVECRVTPGGGGSAPSAPSSLQVTQ
jgi:hypothetical protein